MGLRRGGGSRLSGGRDSYQPSALSYSCTVRWLARRGRRRAGTGNDTRLQIRRGLHRCAARGVPASSRTRAQHDSQGSCRGRRRVSRTKIPTFKLQGERLLYFAGWKKHYSLYPATKTMLEAFKSDLGSAEVVKSTLQFPLAEPVPVKLIERIAKFRAKEVLERKKG